MPLLHRTHPVESAVLSLQYFNGLRDWSEGWLNKVGLGHGFPPPPRVESELEGEKGARGVEVFTY